MNLKPRKAFLQNELNIDRLTPIQWDGIMRAMQKYAEHYNKVNKQFKCATKNSSPKDLKELGEMFINLSDKYKLIEIEHNINLPSFYENKKLHKITITVDEK